ncbi:MAG: efflux RND transporter periplasmic adaptor subunit [Spirochaetales bacterium]|nr:efflux RND transporter periplasmic adaptor subunit [Spirochaetales bacterium]
MNEPVPRRPVSYLIALVLLVAPMTSGCGGRGPLLPMKETAVISPDLSVPPPGSQATLEKWAGFSEDKRRESWQKYMDSLSAQPDPAAASVESVPEPSPETATRKGQPVPVTAAALTRAPIDIYYYGLGEIEAGDTRRVQPLQTGTAQRLYVQEGDFVEEGDLLFALEGSDWLRTIDRAREKWDTEIELTALRLEEAQRTFETSGNFYSRDLITRQEYDKARQSLSEAQLSYERSLLGKKTELETLQENYSSRLGISPVKGYVSGISFTAGETLGTGDYVEIVDIENVVISSAVPENIISRIRSGARVLAKQASGVQWDLTGEVLTHSILPDTARSYQVKARVENTTKRLYPGMLMEVQIQLARGQQGFVVPRKSIIREEGNEFVYVVNGGVVRRIPVETANGRAGMIQIDGALSEGDLFILEGQSYLKDGIPVAVISVETYIPEKIEF